MMNYKRSFIPPKYRPFVNGSTLDNKSLRTSLADRINNPLMRRQMILDIMKGSSDIGGIDHKWAQDLLVEIFPKLNFLKEGNSVAIK